FVWLGTRAGAPARSNLVSRSNHLHRTPAARATLQRRPRLCLVGGASWGASPVESRFPLQSPPSPAGPRRDPRKSTPRKAAFLHGFTARIERRAGEFTALRWLERLYRIKMNGWMCRQHVHTKIKMQNNNEGWTHGETAPCTSP